MRQTPIRRRAALAGVLLGGAALVAGSAGIARAADLRIESTDYAGGVLVVKGVATPRHAVTLDKHYKTTAKASGRFVFRIRYRPHGCRITLRSGQQTAVGPVKNCRPMDAVHKLPQPRTATPGAATPGTATPGTSPLATPPDTPAPATPNTVPVPGTAPSTEPETAPQGPPPARETAPVTPDHAPAPAPAAPDMTPGSSHAPTPQ